MRPQDAQAAARVLELVQVRTRWSWMGDEVGVVDAVDAYFDARCFLGAGSVLRDHVVDAIVDVALGMVRVAHHAARELGHGGERLEMPVLPVDVALKDFWIELAGLIKVWRERTG